MRIIRSLEFQSRQGFDSAVSAPEHDYLNRLPFAHEVYGIATTGPKDWSVRIGIYGEWGTGKTSVLRFVNRLAKADKQIVIFFNPWQFSSTDELWRSFVKAIFEGIEETLGKRQPGSIGRQLKRFFSRAASDVPKIIGSWRKEAATAAETGLAYARRFLTFGPNDLAQLQESLGNRRIIVLIDDLDRTDPKLVPEMLFALKEIMDVPGIAFVCAFDPIVVGKVLGQFHPGFGDGLDFLDKIIDYPRWLPEPTVGELVCLAAADATGYCPYVPKEHLEEVVSLLPRNPRAIRQFIRLLRLLKPQIERHRPDEIRWPILLAANVTKVRFPRIAPELFGNDEFWRSMYFMERDDRENKRKKIVDEQVESLATIGELDNPAKAELNSCIRTIANRLGIWLGIPLESMMYQFHLAERPCAVTWKEFDEFVDSVQGKRISDELVINWIRSHASEVGNSDDQVFKELVDATIAGRLQELGRAGDTTSDTVMRSHMEKADRLMQLLSTLILDVGQIGTEPRISSNQINDLLGSFERYFDSRTVETFREAREAEETLLLEIASKWGPEILPLADAVEEHRILDTGKWLLLVKRLRQIVNAKFASWIIHKFRDDSDFVSECRYGGERAYRVQPLLMDRQSAIWKDRRSEIVNVLAGAPSNETVRGNAYVFLEWLQSLFGEASMTSKISDFLSDNEIALSLWKAATSQPLTMRAVGRLRSLFDHLKGGGMEWDEPEWWTRAVADIEVLRSSSERGSSEKLQLTTPEGNREIPPGA